MYQQKEKEKARKYLQNFFSQHEGIVYFSDIFTQKCEEQWLGSRINKKQKNSCLNLNYFKEYLNLLKVDIDISDFITKNLLETKLKRQYYCSECLKEVEQYFLYCKSLRTIRFFNLDCHMQHNICALEKMIYPQIFSFTFKYLHLKIKQEFKNHIFLKFEGDSMKLLNQILSQAEYLEHLSIYLEQASYTQQIEQGLKNNKSLKSLYFDFGQKILNSDQNLIQAVINGISQNTTLETVYLNLSESDIQKVNLGRIFSATSKLKTLILNLFKSETKLTTLKEFGEGLKKNNSIENLVLFIEKIYIREGEAQGFADGIKKCNTLKSLVLKLQENKMSKDSLNYIIQGLKNNQSLEKLKLNLGQDKQNESPNIIQILENKARKKEIKLKAEFLQSDNDLYMKNDEDLIYLDLNLKKIFQQQLKITSSILASKPQLQNLVLKLPQLSLQEYEQIGNSINNLIQLENLDLNCLVGSLIAFKNIKKLPLLKTFRFKKQHIYRNVSEEGIEFLQKFINNNPSIDKLSLDINGKFNSQTFFKLENQYIQIKFGKMYTTEDLTVPFTYLEDLIISQKKLAKLDFHLDIYGMKPFEFQITQKFNQTNKFKILMMIQAFIQLIQLLMLPTTNIGSFQIYKKPNFNDYYSGRFMKLIQSEVMSKFLEIQHAFEYEFCKVIAFNKQIKELQDFNPLYIYMDLSIQ